MKRLFSGKRKLITIPIISILSLAFLPIFLGFVTGWLIYKKVSNPKLKYSLLMIVAFFAFSIGSVWISEIGSPSEPNQLKTTSTILTPEAQTKVVKTIKKLKPTKVVATVKKLEPTQVLTPIIVAQANKQTAKVIRVIDGDTIDVTLNGKTERIRIIGINAPETADPRKPVECFGQEALVKAKEYLADKTVQLEADFTQGERDKYNRLLRYVWLDNGTIDFGKLMIALGYAYEYTYNLPYKYQTEYKQAQKEAVKGKKGLWADDACPVVTTKPKTVPTQSSGITTSEGGLCKYSCSGPDRDCADFSTHAEAVAFFNCCGFTATNDPMNLDSVGIGDGDPCESLP